MNNKLRMILIAAAASFIFSSSAHAEIVNKTADLQNNRRTTSYVFSRPMLEIMYRLGVEQDRKFGLQTDCKMQYQIKPSGLIVLSPIDFPDEQQHPTKGTWQIRYLLERCGDTKFYNALFIANSSGEQPISRANYPGSSNAGPVLVKDAMLSAITGALVQSGLKDCKNIDVFDMIVTEQAHNVVEGDKTFEGVWNESWAFKVCGQLIDVAMTFIPDVNGGGTSFTTGPAKLGDAIANP